MIGSDFNGTVTYKYSAPYCMKCGGVLSGFSTWKWRTSNYPCSCPNTKPQIDINIKSNRQGWVCPKCDKGISPDVECCPTCYKKASN